MAKGRRNYSERKCGKSPSKARCDMPGVHCINCNWPKMKATSSVAIAAAEGSGNKVPQMVAT